MRVLLLLLAHILTTVADYNLICDITIDDKWHINTCKSTKLIISTPDQFVASLNGNKTKVENVHGLWVEGGNFQYIPRRIDSVLPNLRALGFKDTELTEISKFDLAPFDELETLVLIENKIQFLDGDLFEYNTKIKSLTLNESRILIVNGAILSQLNGLSVIEFRLKQLNDSCKGKCADKRCMKDTTDMFRENCEFDFIYPGFKKTANALKAIGRQCKEKV